MEIKNYLLESEYASNRIVAKIFIIIGAAAYLMLLINRLGGLGQVIRSDALLIFSVAVLLLILSSIAIFVFKMKWRWVKYYIVTMTSIGVFASNYISRFINHNSRISFTLIWLLPIGIAIFYFSYKIVALAVVEVMIGVLLNSFYIFNNTQDFIVVSMQVAIFTIVFYTFAVRSKKLFFNVIESRENIILSEARLRESYNRLEKSYNEADIIREELNKKYEELLRNQEELKHSEERYRLTIEAANDGIWEYDAINDVTYSSDRMAEILDLTKEEIGEKGALYKRCHPDDAEKIRRVFDEYYSNMAERYQMQYRIIGNDGAIRWILSSGKAYFDKNGKPYRMAGTISDITELKEYENKLHHLAYYDTLTNLPNKTYLEEFMVDKLLELARNEGKGALMFIDIDNFKVINDTYGHTFGDRVIVLISERLREEINGENLLIRLGGDSFVALISNEECMENIHKFADRILSYLGEEFDIEDTIVHATSSIGIALIPNDGTTKEELLKNADTALYKIKGDGKNNYAFFNSDMNRELVYKVRMENELRRAIQNDEFILHYQPQYDINTGDISGFEALVRWIDNDNRLIMPGNFINIAEESGLIVKIGDMVLTKACRMLRKLSLEGYNNLYVSVNVSIIQLVQNDFVSKVIKKLERYGIDPKYLEIEITESVFMEYFESNIDKLNKLREYGIRIALDDFGTGYSSLGYLRNLPINTIKIDKCFIDDITSSETENIITGSIVTLGRKIGLEVVAEGVESEEQLQYLLQHECDKVQGFLFSKPLTEEEALNKLSA